MSLLLRFVPNAGKEGSQKIIKILICFTRNMKQFLSLWKPQATETVSKSDAYFARKLKNVEFETMTMGSIRCMLHFLIICQLVFYQFRV